jgi:hypothetical protein
MMKRAKMLFLLSVQHPDQREGDSLRRQTAAAEQYAKQKGWVIDTSLKPDILQSREMQLRFDINSGFKRRLV